MGFSNNPRRCQSCAHPVAGSLDFCGKCLSHAPVFSRAYTLYDYEGAIADLIKAFKYNRQLCVGDYFAYQLRDLYQSINTQYDAVIPMPLSAERITERGYNQVVELLKVLGKQQSVVIDRRCCRRIKTTQPLSSLKLEQRKQEIKGAFSVQNMSYKNVLLVDDVMTTGASMNELAQTILKNTQVERCDVMSLARAVS